MATVHTTLNDEDRRTIMSALLIAIDKGDSNSTAADCQRILNLIESTDHIELVEDT